MLTRSNDSSGVGVYAFLRVHYVELCRIMTSYKLIKLPEWNIVRTLVQKLPDTYFYSI